MTSWSGPQGYLLCGYWWAGLQHVQPGSASGTQAQESWHRWALKEYMSTLRMEVPDFLSKLNQLTTLCVGVRVLPA